MQTFSGFEYLLIDAANQFGLDKEKFDSRLIWAKQNYDKLEYFIPEAPMKTRPAYEKAVQTIRSAAKGEPTGHRVGFDAICSGMQIMSALTNCEHGCEATGLISDEHSERPNAYTKVADAMAHHLSGAQVVVDAADVKAAVMTSLYGSKAVPRNLFGSPNPEDPPTPELLAFYAALMDVAPGASKLLDALLSLWQPFAPKHYWSLPDGHVASVKVMQKVEKRIRVDELNGTSFTYEWYENEGSETGLSLVANVVHSVDAYVLRTLVRRCMYDSMQIKCFHKEILEELLRRELGTSQQVMMLPISKKASNLITLFITTNIADISILNHITIRETRLLSTKHLEELLSIIQQMVIHEPFEVIAVHDEFTCHANNMNHLRNHYRHILADLAESTLLTHVFQQVSGLEGTYTKEPSNNLAQRIRQCNYALS